MTLATRTIWGNHSGPINSPRVVIIHSTRSGIASKTDAQELTSTLNWFQNPNGASSHWVLSELERVRCVDDGRVAWHVSYLNEDAWGIELTQPTIDRPFTDGHYANLALVGQHYVSLGVAPVWLLDWDGDPAVSGFVAHQNTGQGRALGKSDPGPEFDHERFIASLEDDMAYVTQEDLDELKEFLLQRDAATYEAAQNFAGQAKTQAITVSRADLAAHDDKPHGGGGPHSHDHDHAIPESRTGVN